MGGWVAGWLVPRTFIATLWSNLQVCKISSRAEIPKLDRVWQSFTQLYCLRVTFGEEFAFSLWERFPWFCTKYLTLRPYPPQTPHFKVLKNNLKIFRFSGTISNSVLIIKFSKLGSLSSIYSESNENFNEIAY